MPPKPIVTYSILNKKLFRKIILPFFWVAGSFYPIKCLGQNLSPGWAKLGGDYSTTQVYVLPIHQINRQSSVRFGVPARIFKPTSNNTFDGEQNRYKIFCSNNSMQSQSIIRISHIKLNKDNQQVGMSDNREISQSNSGYNREIYNWYCQ
ncbi:hypothetical protein RIF25_06570 [Thermosynechococcaceae cyanobacterium BACA0444]|uniref:Uncharacterized protein n=1 Tax=Pseudocalidococcus azoricus BACA0444 TaxID=2918990 RepID=A0AAE4JVW0_9CYAN|nr:hypothetical protein [Pseudocalidococcus azoricus]MDS3860471.1 hypothetical protein [Pseudocalidococcus azoricus BACA0444]